MDEDHDYTHESHGLEVVAHIEVSTSPLNEPKEVRKQNDEVTVVAQLCDKLTDFIQLLSTEILLQEQQSQPTLYAGKAAKPTAIIIMQKSDKTESIDPGEPVPCQEDNRISKKLR